MMGGLTAVRDALAHLPHLEAYGNPIYFVYLIVALLPVYVGLFYQKRFQVYEMAVSLLFILLMLVGPGLQQLYALVIYVIWQAGLVLFYQAYRKGKNGQLVFYSSVFLAVLPLILVKVTPLLSHSQSLLGFLGISYLTFKSVGMIMEMRDGVLEGVTLLAFLRFLLFMPTFSSGPIDRFRPFDQAWRKIPERKVLLDYLEKAVFFIMLGFLYKFILAHILGNMLLPPLKAEALRQGGLFNLPTLGIMYVYGLDLFFDFAGYSLFAIAISYLMGIESPRNFDQPFKSRDLKEFWNRWHMSLSFWFRDFVFMRLVKAMVKKQVFKNRNTTSSVAYVINMVLMGFWHGLTWYYVAYGLFHGVGLIINDAWLRKKKKINQSRKKAGQDPLPDNKWTQGLGVFITFHVVMLSFLIFSGFLNDLWFGAGLPKK